jgi:hypothetical protein
MWVSCVALLGLCCSTSAFAPVRPLSRATSASPGAVALRMSTPPSNEASMRAKDQETTGFQNDGPFGWMGMYMDMFGMSEGKVIKYGFLSSDPDTDSPPPTSKEQAAARQKAIDNMTNIGTEERQRRDEVGDIVTRLTVAYAVVSSLFLDDGSLGGHLARFAIVLPIFLARGYKLSAETGL